MKTRETLIALAAGVGAAVLRAVYLFLPGALAIEDLVFGAIGFLLGRRQSAVWWQSAGLLILPSMLFVGLLLSVLGSSNIQRGVGSWHAYSAVLIPVTAVVAALLGKRSRSASGPAVA